MMYDGHDGWGWGAWLAMGLMMLAFWGVIAALVVVVVRSSGWRARAPGEAAEQPRDDALRILDERFARGEIDVDEYTRRRDVLRGR
jgi:putative membrane protein